MAHLYAAVWIDQGLARVYELGSGDATAKTVRAVNFRRIRYKAGSGGAARECESQAYFDAICSEIGDAKAILIVGPSRAKFDFKNFVESHYPRIFAHIIGVEAPERETDNDAIAFAKKFFALSDRMAPQLE